MKNPFITLGMLAILFYSCEKKILDHSTQASQDNLTAESIFNDVGYIIEEGFWNNDENPSYPKYTLMNTPDTSGVDTLDIDFGAINYLYKNKYRRGIIRTIYTGEYYSPSSVLTTTFDNYYINNNLVHGERVVRNQGINNNGNMWFTIDVKQGVVYTESGMINWESNKIREWTSGQTTPSNTIDDKYKITGTANGNGVNGGNFSVIISSPLILNSGCLYSSSCVIESGTAKVSPDGRNDRTIDYGDSLCDCNVDVIINGERFPIIIRD